MEIYTFQVIDFLARKEKQVIDQGFDTLRSPEHG
jgi:hypothetical protein